MARLSRTESQAQTREHLLATARELFFATGYVQTSLERVAETAGYSKGAVYSNFRNKDELCAAVLDEVRAMHIGEVAAILATTDPADRQQAFADWAQRVIGDPDWTRLEVEFMVHTRGNGEMRERLGDRIDSIIGLVAASMDAMPGVESRLPSRELATTVLALGCGLGLFRSINPTVPIDGMIDTLSILIRPVN